MRILAGCGAQGLRATWVLAMPRDSPNVSRWAWRLYTSRRSTSPRCEHNIGSGGRARFTQRFTLGCSWRPLQGRRPGTGAAVELTSTTLGKPESNVEAKHNSPERPHSKRCRSRRGHSPRHRPLGGRTFPSPRCNLGRTTSARSIPHVYKLQRCVQTPERGLPRGSDGTGPQPACKSQPFFTFSTNHALMWISRSSSVGATLSAVFIGSERVGE